MLEIEYKDLDKNNECGYFYKGKLFTGIILNGKFKPKRYIVNGKSHREDGPVTIYNNGMIFYYLNGKFICFSKEEFEIKKTL